MSLFRPAQKARIKGRVALAGPTGSGKTWTGLQWARALAGPDGRIAVIDTENRSSELYADDHRFDVLSWDPPYDVNRLAETAKAAVAEQYDVVMVDSLSHFWEGEGGVLDYVDDVTARSPSKNSYMAWKEGTPLLRHLMDTLIWLDAHVIVTLRSKMAYELQEDKDGKKKPVKLGLAPVMRAGVEYEFQVIGDLDLEHTLTISKSRCHPIADKVAHRGRSGEVADTFRAWLDTGIELITSDQASRLRAVVSGIADKDVRTTLARGFKDRFGQVDVLPSDRFDEALSWLAEEAMPADEPAPTDAPEPAPATDTPPGEATPTSRLAELCVELEAPEGEHPHLVAAVIGGAVVALDDLSPTAVAMAIDRLEAIVNGEWDLDLDANGTVTGAHPVNTATETAAKPTTTKRGNKR